MSALDGRWEGVVTYLGVDGPIIVTVDGQEVGVDVPAVGAIGWSLADASVTDTGLEGRLPNGGAVAVSAAGGALRGEVHYPAGNVALDLRRQHPDAQRFLVPRLNHVPPSGPFTDLIEAVVTEKYPLVDDVLAVQGDDMVVEEYFYGRGPDDLHTFQSCTKSITSLVFGTVVDRGYFGSLDDAVWRYLEARSGHRWIDEQYDVSVHDLLRMSVGLDWNEEVAYTDERNDNTRMNQSGDWIGYVLDRPLRPDRVTDAWEYQSGLTILLGAVLKAATGRYVDDLAREYLFGPLGIERFTWLAAPDGTRHTGGGLFLLPRDMLKLGQLVLHDGAWNGAQVVSSAWIRTSTAPQTTVVDEGHGYQWFLPQLQVGDRTVSLITAGGYGGQFLHVIPELSAVVVSNAHDYLGDGSYGHILRDHVAPVLIERSTS